MAVKFADGLWSLMVPINNVQQHPDNPNNGDMDALIESIVVNGFMAPLIVQKSTGYIVAGNHRWQALHALGATEAPVVFSDMSNDRALRYLLADNRTAALAIMDESAQLALLTQLAQSEDGLMGTGFDQIAYEKMLMELAAPEMPEGEGGFGQGTMGIFQVIVEFDNADDRDELLSDLSVGYGQKVRGANL